MGLSPVMHAALSGLSAAEIGVQVTANNLANFRTAGFEASRPVFASQTPQTYSPGAAPSDEAGGSNPTQIGRGVSVAGIVTPGPPCPGDDLVRLLNMAAIYRIESTILRPHHVPYEELASLPRAR